MYFSDINYIHSVVQPPPKLFCNGHPCCSWYQNSIPFHSTCICHIFFIPSSIHGHLGCFHLLTIVNNASVNAGVQISVCMSALNSFGNIPRRAIPESYGHSVCLFFLKNWHTVFHSSHPILHSHQQSTRVQISPYPHQHVFCVCVCVFLGNSHANEYEVSSIGMNHLPVVLIYISLMVSDFKHLLICLLLFVYLLWRNVFSSPLPTF